MPRIAVPLWFALSVATLWLGSFGLATLLGREGGSSPWVIGLVQGLAVAGILLLGSEMRRREIEKEVSA